MHMLYNRIWLTDVRDTYFQTDPFMAFNPNVPSFNVFTGVESMSIKQCGWNSGWVKDCFAGSVLDQIGSENIICSGVSVGTTDIVLKYVEMMRNILMGLHKAYGLENKFPTCERNGVDQGVHNVLVHTKKIPKMKKWDSSGPVANMQAKQATITKGFKVLNSKGEEYAVVHQYDRFPDLQKYLFSQVWLGTLQYISMN